jgi:hypothetical protein
MRRGAAGSVGGVSIIDAMSDRLVPGAFRNHHHPLRGLLSLRRHTSEYEPKERQASSGSWLNARTAGRADPPRSEGEPSRLPCKWMDATLDAISAVLATAPAPNRQAGRQNTFCSGGRYLSVDSSVFRRMTETQPTNMA